jgi:hypothetical protein
MQQVYDVNDVNEMLGDCDADFGNFLAENLNY